METLLEDLTLDYEPYELYRVTAKEVQGNETLSDSFYSLFTENDFQVSVVISLEANEVQIVTPATFLAKSALAFDIQNNRYLNPIRKSFVVEKVLLCANFSQLGEKDLIQIDGFIDNFIDNSIGNTDITSEVTNVKPNHIISKPNIVKTDGKVKTNIKADKTVDISVDSTPRFKVFRILINKDLKQYTDLPVLLRDMFIPYIAHCPINESISTKQDVIVYVNKNICIVEKSTIEKAAKSS